MEVAWSLRVLKGVERTWEVGGCGRWRAAETGFGLGLAKRARSSKSLRSFLFFLLSHIYALLALQLSLRLFPFPASLLSAAFFFLVIPLARPTAHRRDNRKLKKLLPIDTWRCLARLSHRKGKKGRASFAVRNRRREPRRGLPNWER